ncbi:hypothetical protein NDU88_001403 [Pleurodeles waltl]|uniref:Uncharacterized protein n=1 Tax=Pleurodeles waltl TaxID=8319 RepID=A0AAV7R8Y7_PLEWA|nr:hypothetical protein NDU88_001403 [Pleurodeles waltl]
MAREGALTLYTPSVPSLGVLAHGSGDEWIGRRVPGHRRREQARGRPVGCAGVGLAYRVGDRPPSEGIPDLLVQSDCSSATWTDQIAEVVQPSAGVGLCARAPAEGPGWAHLSALVNGEERGPGDRHWIGCVWAVKKQLEVAGQIVVLPARLGCRFVGGGSDG